MSILALLLTNGAEDKVWEQLDVAGPAPRASAGVAFAMLDKGSSKLLVLFGGVRESETADMYTNEVFLA